MRVVLVSLLVACAGCHFSVGSLDGVGGNGGNGGGGGDNADLATSGDDLATGSADDLASVGSGGDLAMPSGPPDMAVDPCANAPALGAGNVAAQCVIGDAPVVDGNLGDWPTSLFAPLTRSTAGVVASGSWTGVPATDDPDLSARWAVRWDTSNVYIAVSVVDDIRQTPSSSALTQNDCVELFFDGNHDRTVSYGSDDWQLVYTADTRTQAYQNGNTVNLPTGVNVQKAWGGVSPNWTLEVAVPWTLLGGTPTLGRVIGFDLKLDDNDTGLSTRDRDLVLYYNAGNGGGSCSAPYCRTDAFGAVQLQGR